MDNNLTLKCKCCYNVHIYICFPFRWVFKQLYDKGLVYRGVKVMPFSTACNTPLSNFEAHQNYKVTNKLLITIFVLVWF